MAACGMSLVGETTKQLRVERGMDSGTSCQRLCFPVKADLDLIYGGMTMESVPGEIDVVKKAIGTTSTVRISGHLGSQHARPEAGASSAAAE